LNPGLKALYDEPLRALYEPLRALYEPLRALYEPLRALYEPLRALDQISYPGSGRNRGLP
jgi:hypothetical protein